MYSSNGVFIISNERIDTGDVSAELKLRKYLEDYEGTSGSTEDLTYISRACGNTIVYEYYYKYAVDNAMVQTLTSNVSKLIRSSQNVVSNIRSISGVSNAQIVYSYFDINGNLLVSGLCDE